MSKIYMFDIDGTLTPARQTMTEDMEEVFTDFCKNNRVYLVTGSDMDKIKQQVPEQILKLVEGVFSCSGNVYEHKGVPVYTNDFEAPAKLLDTLEQWVRYSSCPAKTGRHIEQRPGMLNFSAVGRNCTQEQREEYELWDAETGERRILREKILHMWPYLDCSIGGQISIDIYPKGMNKAQAYNRVRSANPKHVIVFFGDRLTPGGNDYPFFEALSQNQSKSRPVDMAVPVKSYLDTKRFLFSCMGGTED
jgi:phosphomannomutase